MKKIVLFCAAGMSTSLMVTKMKKAAEEEGFDCEINAYAVSKAATMGPGADFILLGPQVRFNLDDVKRKCPGIHVELIDIKAYGKMDGKAVIDHVIEVMNK